MKLVVLAVLGALITGQALAQEAPKCSALEQAEKDAKEAAVAVNGKYHLFVGEEAKKLIEVWNKHASIQVTGDSVGMIAANEKPNALIFFSENGQVCHVTGLPIDTAKQWLKEALGTPLDANKHEKTFGPPPYGVQDVKLVE